jgi:hypothetical protein
MTTPTQPDWYDDPDDPNAQRYWDGQDWTPHRRRNQTSRPAAAQAHVTPPAAPTQAQVPVTPTAAPRTPPPNLPPPPAADHLPPPPAQAQRSGAPRGKLQVTKGGLVLAGLALLVAIAAVVAGRVELGTFLPGILAVAAIGIIAAIFALRSNQSVARKAMVVTAIVVVIAAAIPASLKVVYPVYNHFLPQTSAQASRGTAAGPGSGPEAPSSDSGSGRSGPEAPSRGSAGGGAKSGIVVSSSDEKGINFGYIDPSTGKYTHVSTFNTGSQGSGSLSPDLTRLAASKKDDDTTRYVTHVGWIDTSGKFTSVSPAPPPAADFQQSQPPIYEGPAFDGAGNFYYWERQGTTTHLYKVPAGSTSNAQEITPTPQNFQGGVAPLRNYDGTLHFGCPEIPGAWLGPDKRMAVGTTTGLPGSPADSSSEGYAIIKYPLITSPSGCPALNQNNQDGAKVFDLGVQPVDQPVANPDGTKIAFYNSNSPGGLYVLTIGGDSKPTRIATKSDLNLPNMKLIGWS